MSAVARYAGVGAEDAPVELTPAVDPGSTARRELIPLRLLVDLPGPREETGAVLFIDCDGQAAQDLLTNADRLQRRTARNELADAVRSADALVLVVDCGWNEVEVDATFRSFQQFLGVLESTRTDDREVGGLPVFLTLTKCDTLIRPKDEPTDWLARIDTRKRELKERFEEWFAGTGVAEPFLAFGSTDLRVAATASQLPSIIGFLAYADAVNGFGVADLSDEVLSAARDHYKRTTRSTRRLKWTAGTAIGLLAVMLGVMFGLSVSRPPGPVEALTGRVTRYQQLEGPPAVRLAEANFERNRREVTALRESPVFDKLSPDLQALLVNRDREYAAYAEYRERFQPPQFAPADVRTAADVARLTEEIDGSLTPPSEFQQAWADTELVRLREKWRSDLSLLLVAEEQVHTWYRGQISRASELMLANVPTELTPARWRSEVQDVLSQRPPFAEAEKVPGSITISGRRGEPLTYATVYQLERSANARRDWDAAATKLTDLRDVADALGLTVNPEYAPAPGEPTAVLDLPPPRDPADSLALATARFALLRKRFPTAMGGTAHWAAANFSGPLREEIGRRLRLSAADGVEHVRRLLLVNAEDLDPVRVPNLSRWAAPNGILLKPELQDWGRLLRLLLRWADPTRADADPVTELAEFVKKERFEWLITRLDVALPNALRVRVLKPAGDLTITITDAAGKARVYAYSNGPSPEVIPSASIHRFRPREGSRPVVYLPREGFTAELPLTDGESTFVLKWTDARTSAYQFEKLSREPTIEGTGPGAVQQRASGVRVRPAPESPGFAVPELLPDVK